jgi:D-3-phosphoglycerate dehydrogenase
MSPAHCPGRNWWRRSCRSTLGKIGTLLGAAGVNIQAAQLSEDAEGDSATILLRLDQDVPGDVRSAIGAAVGANKLEVVDLS